MSTLDCQAIYGNWVNWVPDNGSSGCSGTTTILTGNDNPQKAYNYFVGKGLTPAQAAGIVGNLMQESGVNPNSQQTIGGSAKGIAQWESGRYDNLVKFAQSQGKSWNDLGVQLDYLWQELTTTEAGALTAVKATSTASDAAQQFELTFERAGTPAMQNRINNANQVLASYGGAASTIGAGTSCTGGGTFATNFIEYKQCSYGGKTVAWANAPYGSSTVCDAGCGPTAMAMIITNLTGQNVTPDMTALYGAQHGTAYGGGTLGSTWNLAQVVGSHWGLKATGPLGSSITSINQVLQTGGLVLATGVGPEPFTSGGHFIVIRALTSDGRWLTGNSANYQDTTKAYDPQQIITSMQNSWGLTK